MVTENNTHQPARTFQRPIPKSVLLNFLENYDALPGNLLTDETAIALGVKVGTLHVWASTGRHELPFIKIGRSRQYPKKGIRRLIEKRTFNHTGENIGV